MFKRHKHISFKTMCDSRSHELETRTTFYYDCCNLISDQFFVQLNNNKGNLFIQGFLLTAREGNVFTGVCLSSGVICLLGGLRTRGSLSWEGVSVQKGSLSGGARMETPSTTTVAVGTHPTWMHSCVEYFWWPPRESLIWGPVRNHWPPIPPLDLNETFLGLGCSGISGSSVWCPTQKGRLTLSNPQCLGSD